MNKSKFKLEKEIGRGSFGVVFMATRKDTGEKFAIKVVENCDPTTTDAEVAIFRTVNDENIIKYFDSFYNGDRQLNIVMEFANYGTLEEAVGRADVQFEEYCIWRFISQMSCALNYLHTLKPTHVLHRDLKPANVLGFIVYTEFNKRSISWKIADFGISKLLNENLQGEYYAQTTAGTPIYMAPEVCFYNFETIFFLRLESHKCFLKVRNLELTPT